MMTMEGKMKKFTIEMEDGGIMKGELYEDIAPKTVENFEKLANSGFYDGLIFHRVIPGFMIQGGCPQGTGMGGPGYTIPGEFTANGFKNDLKHERGVLSMARAMDPDSAGSQFFIMTSTSPHLDGQYASFGRVTEGMDVADKIVMSKRNMRDKPLVDQKIKSIRRTFDVTDHSNDISAEHYRQLLHFLISVADSIIVPAVIRLKDYTVLFAYQLSAQRAFTRRVSNHYVT